MRLNKDIHSSKMPNFKSLVKFGVFTYSIVLIAVCLSNFLSVWPFGLFASFSFYLLLAAPFVLIFCAYIWRKFILSLVLLGAVAFYPFYTFQKFVSPTMEDCQAIDCLSFVTVNLHHDIEAMKRLSKLPSVSDTDLFLMVDLPYDVSEAKIRSLYPTHDYVQIFKRTRGGNALGSGIAVVSKEIASDIELIENNLESDDFNLRGLVRFSYSGAFSEPVDIFVIHPMMPLARNGMVYRNQLLDRAIAEVAESQNFILAGDFNLTPWEPKFNDLPGKRAGNPRWISTWDATRTWLRLPIDHVMLGRDIQTVEARVMPSIGSDHYPLYTVVRRAGKVD